MSHRIWVIPELLHSILSHVPQKDLVNMACTAKAFHLAALSHVWNDVNDKGIASLLRMVTDGEESLDKRWRRFEQHADLIKHVILGSLDRTTTADLDHLGVIRPHRADKPLLPHLRSLHSFPEVPEDILSTLQMLHPGLETFHFYQPINLIEGVAPAVVSEWTWNLKIIPPYVVPQTNGGSNIIPTGFFSHFPSLSSFAGDSEVLNIDSIQGLAAVKTLRELVLSEYCDTEVSLSLVDIQNGLDSTAFCALESLTLKQTCGNTRTLLALIRGNLQRIDCTIEGSVVPEDVRSLAKSIAGFRGSLKKVILGLSDVIPTDSDPGKWGDLTALLSCRKLVSANVSYMLPGQPFRLVDKDLDDLAVSLPDLQDLSIHWTPRQHMPRSDQTRDMVGGLRDGSALTLGGVTRLLQQCQKLERVYLTYFDAEPRAGMLGTNDPVLRKVDISMDFVELSSPYKVGMFLSHWIPRCTLKLGDPLKNKTRTRQLLIVMTIVQATLTIREPTQDSEAFDQLVLPESVKGLEELAKRPDYPGRSFHYVDLAG